jgi:hypothetical protein
MASKDHIQLNDGEQELCRLDGNAYTISFNPLVRIIMFFVKIIQFLSGSISKILVITTSERVVLVKTQKMLWIFDQSITSTTVFPRGIVKIGYSMQRSFIFFKTHYLTMTSGGKSEIFSSKNGKKRVEEMIKEIKSLKEKTSGY